MKSFFNSFDVPAIAKAIREGNTIHLKLDGVEQMKKIDPAFKDKFTILTSEQLKLIQEKYRKTYDNLNIIELM